MSEFLSELATDYKFGIQNTEVSECKVVGETRAQGKVDTCTHHSCTTSSLQMIKEVTETRKQQTQTNKKQQLN